MTNSLTQRSARLLAIIATLLPILTLSGCGQKGPLYLPGNPSEIKTEISKQESTQEKGQEMPANEQQDEEDDEDSDEQPE